MQLLQKQETLRESRLVSSLWGWMSLLRSAKAIAWNVPHVAILREETAAADGGGSAAKEGESLFCKKCYFQNMRNGDHLLIFHGGAVVSCPETDRRVYGKAGSVSHRVLHGLRHGPAMKSVD